MGGNLIISEKDEGVTVENLFVDRKAIPKLATGDQILRAGQALVIGYIIQLLDWAVRLLSEFTDR
ncbi:hypothetical protein GCM10028773_26350 [Spirosoma koreense]